MNRIACAIVGCALLCLGGCKGDGPEIVEVEGTATHKGKPLPNLRVYFAPSEGRPSWGITDQQGKFRLDYDLDHDGAKVGKHTVYVLEDPTLSDPTAMDGKPRPKKSPELQEVLTKYGKLETSPLKIEIKKRETNLELKLD